MIALTERSSRAAPRLGTANRRLVAEQGRRLPSRLRNGFDRLSDADHGASLSAQRGSLLDALAPERA